MQRLLRGLAAASLLSLALAPAVSAHSGIEVGDYLLQIGWKVEPAFVGQPNAAEVTVLDHHDGSPVLDLGSTGLKVVVSTAGQDSPSLDLVAAFDSVEKTGPLGEYDAAIVPTAPGDYSFHITGKVRDQTVDVTLASSEETFDPVRGSSDLEFPARLPTLAEVATRLDRIDSRIAALQSAEPGSEALSVAEDAMNVANAAVSDARDARAAANSALVIGAAIGGAGLFIALVAIVIARRKGAAAA